MLTPVKQRIVDEHTAITGAHDDPAVYAGPPGDPGLLGPDSISWRVHADVAAMSIAGAAAITMELLHPAVMAGVHERSTYREQPFKRARATAGYVVQTTFGNTEAAHDVIGRVRRMHERISGTLPDGRPYRAMDPEILAWVHTCIPWAIMLAYDRYTRPLSTAERDQYLAEQAIIGRLSGAGDIPETYADLLQYVEAMRPQLVVSEQTRTFFSFLLTAPFGPKLPEPLAYRLKRLNLQASLSIMPPWVAELTGYAHPEPAQRLLIDPLLQLNARTTRWAFCTPPYAAMAAQRMAGETAPARGARRTALA
ncbi:MAG: DUF2236 domain-containing protein [Solirubrobacteraceae bacterium]|nr:DUF2236 domain-containing protein [Solirubrobacteraceae bacterium]